MTDINKELEEILLTFTRQMDEQWPYATKDPRGVAIAKIKALVVESIGKDEVFIDIAEVDHTGKVTKRHFGESYTPYMLARNQLRGEIRSIFE